MNFTSASAEAVPPKPQVLLASQSVGRRFLLEKLSIPFRTIPTSVDEEKIVDPNPTQLIKKRARAKAIEVVSNPRVYNLSQEVDSLIVAADSMAAIGKKTYGKPADKDQAKHMLEELMGRTHTLYTALCVIHFGKGDTTDFHELKRWETISETKVTMNKLSKPELETYVARYDLTRFAACYALNDIPWDLIAKIDGSYTNVIGLPFEELLPILRKLQIV